MKKSLTIVATLLFLNACAVRDIALYVINQDQEKQAAREAEGMRGVGAIIRAERDYYFENSKFTESISDSGIDIFFESKYYDFDIKIQDPRYVKNQDPPDFVTMAATPKSDKYKSWTGGVIYNMDGEGTFNTIICVADEKGTNPSPPFFEHQVLECAQGSSKYR